MSKKKGIYIFRGKKYKDFKEMKRVAYFSMSENQKEIGYYMVEDEIWMEYEFDKRERRIICSKKYDYEEQARIEFEKKQLNLW